MHTTRSYLALASLLACSLAAGVSAQALAEAAPGSAAAADPVTLLGEAPIAALLDRLGEDVALFDMHIVTLANPFFEGRGATTIGNERAADYIAFHFEKLGLTPAFPETADDETITPNASYSQHFAPSEVRQRRGPRPVKVLGSDAGIRVGEGEWAQLIPDLDYSVLGCSGTAEVEGQLVFVGYSISAGVGGYLGYPAGTDLEGKIAVALRYEPLNEDGSSKWSDDDSWSMYAQLEPKISAAVRRGASAIIIVTPPGIPGDSAQLATAAATADGEFDIPVIMLSQERADFLLSKADPEGRSLLELRKIVDESPAIIDMPGATVRLSTSVDRTPDMSRNVGALLKGRGDLADELIVLGAHFDHAGYGQYGGRERDTIHPGADDNASGTSAMLLAAKRLSEAYAELADDADARSILFLAFTAEEWGLLGSRYYAANPIVPIEDHVFMFNMDMVGRVRENAISIGGFSTAEGFEAWAQPYLDASGLSRTPLPRGVFGRSDHASFFKKGVPCLFFFSGFHDDYHAPGDVSMLINRVGAVQVSQLCQNMTMALATQPDRPVFVNDDGTGRKTDSPPAARPDARKTNVRFGVQPGSYDATSGGITFERVFPGTSAADAGLQTGDIMTHWGETKLESIEDWMPMLGAAKPGDKVIVGYIRDGESHTTEVTLKAAGG